MIIAETSRLNHAQHKSVLKSLKAHIASLKAALAAMEAGIAQLIEECEILRRCRPLWAFVIMSGWFEDPSETIAETIDSNLLSGIDDLVAVLFENNPTRFLKASDIPVNGTNHSLFAFEIDAVMLDIEVGAALRASGFELSDGDDAVASHFRSPIWLYMVTWAYQRRDRLPTVSATNATSSNKIVRRISRDKIPEQPQS
jgi:hypothetical protein